MCISERLQILPGLFAEKPKREVERGQRKRGKEGLTCLKNGDTWSRVVADLHYCLNDLCSPSGLLVVI